MTSYPLLATLPNPYKTPHHKIVSEFAKAVESYSRKPYHVQRLLKILGKKIHVKFCISQKQALASLMEFASDPTSVVFRKIRKLLGLANVKIDGVQSKINTLAVLICCLNVETMTVGIRDHNGFSHFSQPYLAKVADCSPSTIYRHLKSFATTGLMKQVSRNEKIGEGLYIYHTSLKVVFERMFNILGVPTIQLAADKAYFTQKRKAAAEAAKPKPEIKPDINPDTQSNPTLEDDVLIESVEEFKPDSDRIDAFMEQAKEELAAVGVTDATANGLISISNRAHELLKLSKL